MNDLWTFLHPRLIWMGQTSREQLLSLLPAALVGTVIGSLLLRYEVKGVPARFLELPGLVLVPIAAVLGAVSPICTLGTVPIILGMVRRGFPISASITFLTSSSIVTPQMVFIAVGAVGPEIATLQVVGGITLSVMLGIVLHLVGGRVRFFRSELTEPAPSGAPQPHGRSCRRHETFPAILWKELRFVVSWLLVGVLVSAALREFVEPYVTPDALAGGSFVTTFAGALVSIPAYACGGFALPVLGGLKSSGLHVSAILAVMVCGPATRLKSLAALGRIVRPRALAGYLAVVMAFSVAYGVLCEALWLS